MPEGSSGDAVASATVLTRMTRRTSGLNHAASTIPMHSSRRRWRSGRHQSVAPVYQLQTILLGRPGMGLGGPIAAVRLPSWSTTSMSVGPQMVRKAMELRSIAAKRYHFRRRMCDWTTFAAVK